jgi:hypothetical protein
METSLDSRVGTLEANMMHVREDVAEIKADIKSINQKFVKFENLPTKGDLFGYMLASLGIMLAIMGVTIGGIVGGLSWIQHH